MKPSLLSGDIILVTTNFKSVKIGDIVIFNTGVTGLIVKRLAKLKKPLVELKADNPRLDSSLCDRELDVKNAIGRVLAVWRRPLKFQWVKPKL